MDSDKVLEYGWVFAIIFFLVLFLSQALYIWIIGPVGSFFAWLLLVIWSFWASFFLLFGKANTFVENARERVRAFVKREPLYKEQIKLDTVREVEKLASKPQDTQQKGTGLQSDLEKVLEGIAHKNGVLISGEALHLVSKYGNESEQIFETMIGDAKKTFPRFDGWVVLNKSQVLDLLPEVLATSMTQQNKTKKSETNITAEKNIFVPTNLPIGTLQSKETHATATLVGLLCKGSEDELFTFIRGIRQGETQGVRHFIREVVLILDSVHEHRVDGVGYVDPEILEHTKCFSNEEIEEIIAILIGSIDYRYALPELGVKIALVRAVEYIKKARSN